MAVVEHYNRPISMAVKSESEGWKSYVEASQSPSSHDMEQSKVISGADT